jgi:hypothetical protein
MCVLGGSPPLMVIVVWICANPITFDRSTYDTFVCVRHIVRWSNPACWLRAQQDSDDLLPNKWIVDSRPAYSVLAHTIAALRGCRSANAMHVATLFDRSLFLIEWLRLFTGNATIDSIEYAYACQRATAVLQPLYALFPAAFLLIVSCHWCSTTAVLLAKTNAYSWKPNHSIGEWGSMFVLKISLVFFRTMFSST